MPLAKYSWQSISFFVAGVIFALRPEVGIVFLSIILLLIYQIPLSLRKILYFLSKSSFFKSFSIIFVLIILRIFISLQTLNPWQGFLESIAVVVFLAIDGFLLKWGYKFFGYGLLFGSFLLLIIVLYPRYISSLNKNLYWQNDTSHAIHLKVGNISRFIAVRTESAWIVNNLSAQGPGHIRYQFEIRSNKSFQVNTFFIHSGLLHERSDKLCEVSSEWHSCTLDVILSSRGWATMGIGGSSTWNSRKPYFEVKDVMLTGDVFSSILDVFSNPTRVSGFDFNENAFGVHMAIIGIVLIAFTPAFYGIIAAVPILFCIVLSGSRGALIAYVVGVIIYFIGRNRWYKLLLWMFAIMVFLVILLQIRTLNTLIQPTAVISFRSLVTDHNSTQNRFEIWRLATKAWLDTPRSFLIGTGDLTSAMKAEFDTRSSRYGLTKESLTHAHNLWLQTLGESGLLGFLVLFWLWCWVIFRAWRARDSVALALLAAVFIMNSVDYLFFYAPVQLCFWMATVGFQRQKMDDKYLNPNMT